MSCCASAAQAHLTDARTNDAAREIQFASRDLGDGTFQTELAVPGARCGACISTIESSLMRLDGVISARMNLSARRVGVVWKGDVPAMAEALKDAGFESSLAGADDDHHDAEMRALLRATAVASFAAMNIMVLSVSVWSGADEETRQAFHILSALIAVPAVAYAGRVFFIPALKSLRALKASMDLPISVGILLALVLSLYDTVVEGSYAYFDAVTSLMFVLLAGRTLDHAMRTKARKAVSCLAGMMPRGATVVRADGQREYRRLFEIKSGELVLLLPGDRVPLDGTIVAGHSSLDVSLVTGESVPERASPGTTVLSGTLNLDGVLTLRADKIARDSFLSEMMGMMEAAETGRAVYRRIADRVAALYSPLVHALALLTCLGWLWATSDLHQALTIAVCVLIITCPCALGLAVPIVHVVAAGRLFKLGVSMKDGSALERLATVDTVIFDKTGTLTLGNGRVTDYRASKTALAVAAALAGHSRHPVARAIATLGTGGSGVAVADVRESPGDGMEGTVAGHVYKLGRKEWAVGPGNDDASYEASSWLTADGNVVGWFSVADQTRPHAAKAVNELHALGCETAILSGDKADQVAAIAKVAGIAQWQAHATPQAKVTRLAELKAQGRNVLMVGDGLNDAPALGEATVSMAPSTAADVGRNAADLVFLHPGLDAVPKVITIARAADRLVRQNLTMAAAYNVCFIPVAVAGYVTPLLAAIAMSTSSILVVANALRLSAADQQVATGTAGLQRVVVS